MMGDWFQQTISRYPVLELPVATQRTDFMQEFDLAYERTIQPLFLWFVYKVRINGWQGGHCVSEWRLDGSRIGSLWMKVNSHLQQFTITASSASQQIRCGGAAIGLAPVVLANSCAELTEGHVAEHLQRFLEAVLDSETGMRNSAERH